MPLQTCPKCDGQGTQSKPPWVAGDVDIWSNNCTVPYTCQVCKGKGVISGDFPADPRNSDLTIYQGHYDSQ